MKHQPILSCDNDLTPALAELDGTLLCIDCMYDALKKNPRLAQKIKPLSAVRLSKRQMAMRYWEPVKEGSTIATVSNAVMQDVFVRG